MENITITKEQLFRAIYDVEYHLYDSEYGTNEQEFIERATEYRYHVPATMNLETYTRYVTPLLDSSAKLSYLKVCLRSKIFNAYIVEDDKVVADKLRSYEKKVDDILNMDEYYDFRREYNELIKQLYQN